MLCDLAVRTGVFGCCAGPPNGRHDKIYNLTSGTLAEGVRAMTDGPVDEVGDLREGMGGMVMPRTMVV
jgi:hypothetical protein